MGANELKTRKNLDAIIKIAKENITIGTTLDERFKNLCFQISGNDNYKENILFQSYLTQLIDIDKYIYKKISTHKDGGYIYLPTVKGELFDGYVKQKELEVSTQRLLSFQSWCIAIGTAGLLLVEIIKSFCCSKGG